MNIKSQDQVLHPKDKKLLICTLIIAKQAIGHLDPRKNRTDVTIYPFLLDWGTPM